VNISRGGFALGKYFDSPLAGYGPGRRISKAHFASRLFKYNCGFQLRENKQKLYAAFNKLALQYLGYKLRTD